MDSGVGKGVVLEHNFKWMNTPSVEMILTRNTYQPGPWAYEEQGRVQEVGSGRPLFKQGPPNRALHRALTFSEMQCPHCTHEETDDFWSLRFAQGPAVGSERI